MINKETKELLKSLVEQILETEKKVRELERKL